MANLITAQCHLTPQPSQPFHVLATRYYLPETVDDQSGYTLIFLHAVGMHKESWETTIRHLFEISTGANSHLRIRDAYSIESPNHGESAAFNEQIIRREYEDHWPTRVTAGAVQAFLTADVSQGAKIDFSKRMLIGIGHSYGAATLFLMRPLVPRVKFESIIAIEPGIAVKDLPEMRVSAQMLTVWSWLRRDIWSSRSAARKDLAKTPVYQTWDPRVLDLYVKHGLKSHYAKNHPAPFTFNGVTTCLSREQEAGSFRSDDLVVGAMEGYTMTTRELPVHLVFGKINDVASPVLQRLLLDEKAGRTPASVSYVEDAGHLAVQQKPDNVAKIIFSILSSPSPRDKLEARL